MRRIDSLHLDFGFDASFGKIHVFGKILQGSFHGEWTRLMRAADLPVNPEMERFMGSPLFKGEIEILNDRREWPSAIPSSAKETLPPWKVTDHPNSVDSAWRIPPRSSSPVGLSKLKRYGICWGEQFPPAG